MAAPIGRERPPPTQRRARRRRSAARPRVARRSHLARSPPRARSARRSAPAGRPPPSGARRSGIALAARGAAPSQASLSASRHSPASSRGTRSSSRRSVIPQSTRSPTGMPSTSNPSGQRAFVNRCSRRMRRVPQLGDGRRQHLGHLLAVRPPLDPGRDAAEEREHVHVRRAAPNGRELGDDVTSDGSRPISSSASRSAVATRLSSAASTRPPGNASCPPWWPWSVRTISTMRSSPSPSR